MPDMVQPRGAAPAPAATAASVTPRPGAGPQAPAPAAAAAPAPQDGAAPALPEEVVQLPPVTAILAGEPAAFSVSIDQMEKRPEGQLIAQHAQALQEAGVGFYGALDGKTGVIFNGFYMNPEELKQADQQGKLLEVAPPMDEVEKGVPADQNIAHKGLKSHPGQLANAPAANPDQSASAQAQKMKVPGANTSPGKQKVRSSNQGLGDPSSGPKPGSGRLLNNILKPVV